ncbi:Nicotinate degradation protein R [Hartmannibacter diazotrophicus]|uniref:Nicotinate degradation protein R n=1 Tax=Hartmannibacter diazotrophicus TaxID=1482074 RepID=A0A2C9DCN5_9HYPH|nr:Nicotinate degradation protein R [Hartmannibacter diazotrophicus]
MKPDRPSGATAQQRPYVLDEQVGFVLRQVSQRHATIFANRIGCDVTPTQWAALSKLAEVGPTSQNRLGRLTAMDVATIKGVIDRLIARGFVTTETDPEDARRRLLTLSEGGRALVQSHIADAFAISEETVAPLDEADRAEFIRLLAKLR